jgi:phosphoglycerate dehydrogenase-like enzyme
VVGARAHSELTGWLRPRRPDIEYRGAPHTEVTQEMMDWAQTYIGFRRPLAATLGSVRWVHCTGAGVDAWLYPNEIDRDILLTKTPESFGPMIAEWVLARLLAIGQGLLTLAAAQQSRVWSSWEPTFIAGSRALIVGMGDVGRATAKALDGCGVRVSGVSRSGTTDSPHVRTMHAASALPNVVSDADWIVITLPLTRDTEGLVSRDILSRCRGAVLLNTGRGAVVDEGAIPEALDRGWLRGAALDVFHTEPLPADSPLWGDARVMISPHCSGPTTIAGAGEGFLECLRVIEGGTVPRWAVDRERGY